MQLRKPVLLIRCTGKRCKGQNKGYEIIDLKIPRALTSKGTNVKVPIEIARRCKDGTWVKKTILVALKDGTFDRAKSDLDGNGVVGD